MKDESNCKTGEPLPAVDAIVAMVRGKETLYSKDGDVKYFWDGKCVRAVDEYFDSVTIIDTFDDETFYRRPVKRRRLMTRWEVLDWANREASRRWVVKVLAAEWKLPQYFDYCVGIAKYQRARLLPDLSGVDESTVQGFEIEEGFEVEE
jgi:hypothetical protein